MDGLGLPEPRDDCKVPNVFYDSTRQQIQRKIVIRLILLLIEVNTMPDFHTFCPFNEEHELTFSEKEIARAKRFRNKSGGKIMVACPFDCRALAITKSDGTMPDDVEAWIPDESDAICVPLLNDTVIRMPAGFVLEAGVKLYRPGGGGPLLGRREYMFAHGIDPECHLNKG